MEKKTFNSLLAKLREADEALDSEEVDWGELVGNLKDKVDSIYYVRKKLEQEILFLDTEVKLLEKRKKTVARNLSGLDDYVKYSMIANESMIIPGEKWQLLIKQNPEKVIPLQEPNVDLWFKHQDLVTKNVTYNWDKNAIKKSKKEGKMPAEINDLMLFDREPKIVFKLIEKDGE